MFAFSAQQKKWLTILGALLTIAAAVAVAVAFFTIQPLKYNPRDGIHLFYYPAFIALILGWLLPARRARMLLLGGFAALVVWIIGFSELACVGLLLLDAIVVGEFTWRKCGFSADEPGLLHAGLVCTLGVAEIGLLLTLVSHFYIPVAAVYTVGLALIALLGRGHIAVYGRAFGRWLASDEKVSPAIWLAVGALFGAVLLNFATSTYFGSEGDTLGVYMYVPSYIGTYGGWSYDFHTYIWAVMPNLLEALDSVPYVLSGPTGAQFFNSACTVLTGLLIYAFCKPRIGTFNALLCAIGWLTIPGVVQESASLHDDTVLALFLFAALVCLYDPRLRSARPWAAGAVTGLLVSAAVATKLMGWILCPAYMLVVLVWFGREKGFGWMLQAAVAAMAVVLVAGGFQYWYALAVTGNPIFPYYNAIFHSPYFPWSNFLDRSSVGRFNWDLPFLLTFHTEPFGLGGPGSTGFQWLPLLPAALLFSVANAGNQRRWFGFAGLWFAVLVMLPEQFVRYLIPAYPFLSVFIGEVGAQPGLLIQTVFRAVYIGAIALNVYGVQDVFYNTKDIVTEPVFSLQKRALVERGAAPMISINKIINALEPNPVNVLDLARGEGAGLHGTAYYVSWQSPEVSHAFGDAIKSGDFGRFIGDYKISYVVFDTGFDKHGQGQPEQTYDFCEQHGTRVIQVGSIILYKIDPMYTYPQQALVNPGLADDAKGWTLYKLTKPEPLPGSGYLLHDDGAFTQDLQATLVVSGRDYYLHVVASCLNQKGWVYPRMVWKIGQERREVGSGALLFFCSQKGPLDIRQVVTVPPDAVAGSITVSANAGAQADVQSISLSY